MPQNKKQQSKKPRNAAQSSNPNYTNDTTNDVAALEFTPEDFTELLKDPYKRFENNSENIGHAVLMRNENGEMVALQYQMPHAVGDEHHLSVTTLTDIAAIQRYGATKFKGHDETGKTFYARRFVHAHVTEVDDDEKSIDIALFSEGEEDKEPFWGSTKKLKRFKDDLNAEDYADFMKELDEIPLVVKCGNEEVVEVESVKFRNDNPKRTPDQNTVMGESARDHFEHVHSMMHDVLSEDLSKLMVECFTAWLGNKKRPEWLHGSGFGLTPLRKNPQTKGNLGAAPAWVNTRMMVLECVAKQFAMLENADEKYKIKIHPLFIMFLDTEIIDRLFFCIEIENKYNTGEKDALREEIGILAKKIKFFQNIDPFTKFPIYSKASDLAQLAFLTNHILNNNVPNQVLNVESSKNVKLFNHHPQELLNQTQTSTSSSATVANASSEPIVKSKKSAAKKNIKHKLQGDSNMSRRKLLNTDYHSKVPKILTTYFEPDYDEPWIGSHISNCRGSGFVIEHNNEKYVVTNSHCVSNHVNIEIELMHKTFEAELYSISYQSDLALLRIKSKEFQEIAEPVMFGNMIKAGDKVSTVGYPIGGAGLSRTDGVASRIESGFYSMGNVEMLQIQVDAAINPGNSGGPVFHKDKLIGVAFQGLNGGENIGYIIPVEFVKHFLTEAFSGKPYRGYPILPISCDTKPMRNKYLRREYKMNSQQTGILVESILDPKCGIKPHDVITEIDGYQVHNDGKVVLPDIGAVDWSYLCHRKFVDDTVKVTLLRLNDRKQRVEEHELEVILKYVPFDVNLVGRYEYDKMPNFLINSSILYTPVTRNYLEGPGSDLEDMVFIDPKGSYRLVDAPKKFPDQELVALSVLASKYTKGYEHYNSKIVKKVNGVEIRNFQHLQNVLESHEGRMHRIETSDDKLIIVKNLSPQKLQQVLDRYHIPSDRPKHMTASSSAQAFGVQSDSSNSEETVSVDSKALKRAAGKRRKDTAPKNDKVYRTPGLTSFFKHVDSLQQLALAESEDDVLDFDRLSEEASEEESEISSIASSDNLVDSDSSVETTPVKTKFGFWSNKTNEQDDEEKRPAKRQRRIYEDAEASMSSRM